MYQLEKIADKLCLVNTKNPTAKPFYIDFASRAYNYRLKHSTIRSETIARAVGLGKYGKSAQPLYVLDATAGLGRDAFILASLGCKVLMIERCRPLAQLLADALRRGKQCAEIAPYINNMSLLAADARHIIADKSIIIHRPDVVYLDPMFPEIKKSAKVKIEMQILRELVIAHATNKNNIAIEYENMFVIARKLANKRVVVKRHKTSPRLIAEEPSFTLTGRTVRFDVYC